MTVNPPPQPHGSRIEVIENIDGCTYWWKSPSGGPFRYFIAIFLLIWLCGWFFGFIAALNQILKQPGNVPEGFLIIWLAGWSIGGIFAMGMAYFLLRTPKPEKLSLSHNSFRYDSGSALPIAILNPWYGMRHANPFEPFSQLFKRRKIIEFSKDDFGKIVLERVGERQRLRFDHGADRIEIGEHLSEPDREWLAEVIENWKSG